MNKINHVLPLYTIFSTTLLFYNYRSILWLLDALITYNHVWYKPHSNVYKRNASSTNKFAAVNKENIWKKNLTGITSFTKDY